MRIIKKGNPPWTPELMCECPMCETEFALTQFEVETRDGKPGATCPVCYRYYPLNKLTEDEYDA